MNKLLNYLKEYALQWILVLGIMYSTFTVPLIIYFIIVFPKIEWLLLQNINPIAIIVSVFGAFVISVSTAVVIGNIFGLKDLVKSLKIFEGETKSK